MISVGDTWNEAAKYDDRLKEGHEKGMTCISTYERRIDQMKSQLYGITSTD